MNRCMAGTPCLTCGVAGTSYTYTLTAVGPGMVSNTIGPFVP